MKKLHTVALAFGFVGASALPSALLAQEPLIASNDLPGVPVSITDRQRVPVSADSGDGGGGISEDQQRAYEQRQQDIAQMQQEADAMLAQRGGNVSQAQARARDEASKHLPEPKEPVLQEAQRITAVPGVNQVVPISRGHPNRVVVPFENAQIRTTSSEAEITAQGPVIYVATNSSRPVTVFVSPRDNERLAISLTMVPRPVPPQEINIELEQQNGQQIRMASPSAQRWEERTPYVDTLTSIFTAMARQDLPQGYSLRSPSEADILTCYLDSDKGDVGFEIAQVAEGHNIAVQVVVATNNGGHPVEIIGSLCAGHQVLAAAEWPRSILEPGQQTEVFVARQRLDEAQPEIRRPSTIGE